jgi:hypothetical protein
MTVINLTTASPESEELEYIEGVMQALVDGNATFGGATLRLSVSIQGSDFVLATTDDFAITEADSLRFCLNNGSLYKLVLDPVGAGADMDVYLDVDPNAVGSCA